MIGVIAAGISIASSAMANRRARKAAKLRAAAAAVGRKLNRLAQYQQARSYMNQFRQAQAAAVIGGLASGADIESSAVQGTISSQETQARVAGNELILQQGLAEKMGMLEGLAGKMDGQAATASTIGSVASQFIGFSGASSGPSFSPGGGVMYTPSGTDGIDYMSVQIPKKV